MALFGAPLDDENHADHAVETALEMLEELGRLNAEWAAAGRPSGMDIGVGINTGPMIAGNIGSNQIMSYTVIGDSVNLGSRLESANKQYGTRIIISDETRSRLKGTYTLRPLGAEEARHFRLAVLGVGHHLPEGAAGAARAAAHLALPQVADADALLHPGGDLLEGQLEPHLEVVAPLDARIALAEQIAEAAATEDAREPAAHRSGVYHRADVHVPVDAVAIGQLRRLRRDAEAGQRGDVVDVFRGEVHVQHQAERRRVRALPAGDAFVRGVGNPCIPLSRW